MSKFRESFKLKHKITQWFPGHMYKGILQIQARLKKVDCVIEVHDARVPFSGRDNSFLGNLKRVKPHILVLNKMDLADLKHRHDIDKELVMRGVNKVVYTDCNHSMPHNEAGYKEILPTALRLMEASDRVNREESADYNLMIVGVPNVGKSSLINRLRQCYLKRGGKPTRVGALAGVTRSMLEKIKIHEYPKVYLFDTPGILEPRHTSNESALRLALCASFSDTIIGEQLIADYLLFWLNKRENYSYIDYLGLTEACDDITEVLLRTAIAKNFTIVQQQLGGTTVTRPCLHSAACYFIKGFRKSEFGRILLDDNIVRNK